MDQYREIDLRIEAIWEKIMRLPEKKEYSCGIWPPVWEAPLTEEEVADFEKKNGIRLPEDYRRFITTKASGGSQPFYGLDCPLRQQADEYAAALDRPFPYTVGKPLVIAELTKEEQQAYYNDDGFMNDGGYLLLCTEGCGMDSILIVNSTDTKSYGTVWFYDLANDYGVLPLLHPSEGKTLNFLDWLEYWVDFMLRHGEEDYFSYGELTEQPE